MLVRWRSDGLARRLGLAGCLRLAAALSGALVAAAALAGVASPARHGVPAARVAVQAPETTLAAKPVALPPFTARENWPQGREEGEVLCGQHVVLRLRAPLGGLSAYERAMIAAKRLNDFVEDYSRTGPLSIIEVDGQWVVRGVTINIVTCDPQTAQLNNRPPRELAEVWVKNIREILDHPELAYATPTPQPVTPTPGPEPAVVPGPGPGPAPGLGPAGIPEGPAGETELPPLPPVATVPVIAVVGGQKIGVGLVTGEPEVLEAVKSVAALQGTYQKVARITALVPTADETPTGASPRLVGAKIVGVRLAAKVPPPSSTGRTGGGTP